MLSKDIQRLKNAILMNEGNLTRSAALLEVSKQHVMSLVKRHGLNEWARDVRLAHGHPHRGTPYRRPVTDTFSFG